MCFLRFASEVGIAEQAFLSTRSIAPVKAENDDMYMRLSACVRSPGEGAVGKGNFQFTAVEKNGPKLCHLLALRDGVGRDEAYSGGAFLHVFTRLDEPSGYIVERSAALAERSDLTHLRALLRDVRREVAAGTRIETAIGRVASEERGRWIAFDGNHPRNVTASFTELEWE